MKTSLLTDIRVFRYVSNPWREAIEGSRGLEQENFPLVSNPWREAIEEIGGQAQQTSLWFPILGGRLLKGENYVQRKIYRKVSNPWREAIEETVWYLTHAW